VSHPVSIPVTPLTKSGFGRSGQQYYVFNSRNSKEGYNEANNGFSLGPSPDYDIKEEPLN
jgi:hypothetical protein